MWAEWANFLSPEMADFGDFNQLEDGDIFIGALDVGDGPGPVIP